MSAQKNTLFNYFGKSPSAKPSPSSSSTPATPKVSRVTDSPLGTPKRALASPRGGSQGSPKNAKCVVREHLMAASPRTRVQRKLLDSAAAASTENVYEPHFLRKVQSPQLKKSLHCSSLQKNKENSQTKKLSPVFHAINEDESRSSKIRAQERDKKNEESHKPPEDSLISPSKWHLRRPVRNLNKEFVGSPLKVASEKEPHGKKMNSPQELNHADVDVFASFGQYVAAEMRRLESEKSVRTLKQKIMTAILEVQSEQEIEV